MSMVKIGTLITIQINKEYVIAITSSLTEGLLNRGNADEVLHSKHVKTQKNPNSQDLSTYNTCHE
jgi:hypothetical protein